MLTSALIVDNQTYLEELPLLKAVDTTRASWAEMVALLVDGPPEFELEVDEVVTF